MDCGGTTPGWLLVEGLYGAHAIKALHTLTTVQLIKPDGLFLTHCHSANPSHIAIKIYVMHNLKLGSNVFTVTADLRVIT